MTTQTYAPVTSAVTVDLPPAAAFELFTTGIDKWWPRSHHIGATELSRAVLEPRSGGRWYEVGADGTECEWGHVLAWEPPRRLVLAWAINSDWQHDPDLVTEVELIFEPRDGGTLVSLEHRNLERFGDRAADMRQAFESGGGWPGLLGAFADAAGA